MCVCPRMDVSVGRGGELGLGLFDSERTFEHLGVRPSPPRCTWAFTQRLPRQYGNKWCGCVVTAAPFFSALPMSFCPGLHCSFRHIFLLEKSNSSPLPAQEQRGGSGCVAGAGGKRMGSGGANVMLPQHLPGTKKLASFGQGALFLLGLPTAESRSSRDTLGHGPPGASVHKSLQGLCCKRYDCFSGV